MISDVLSNAVAAINGYLTDPVTAPMYPEPIASQIRRLCKSMDELRCCLDDLPNTCPKCGLVGYRYNGSCPECDMPPTRR